jgi:hypothetical protein
MDRLSLDEEGCHAAGLLLEDVRGPLTAACNYLGAARLVLQRVSPGARAGAVPSLQLAEADILRTCDLINRVSDSIGPEAAHWFGILGLEQAGEDREANRLGGAPDLEPGEQLRTIGFDGPDA